MTTYIIESPSFLESLERISKVGEQGDSDTIMPEASMLSCDEMDLELSEKISSGEYSHEDWGMFLHALSILLKRNGDQVPPIFQAAVGVLDGIDKYLTNGGDPQKLVSFLRLGRRLQRMNSAHRHPMVAATVAVLRERDGMTLEEACETVALSTGLEPDYVEKLTRKRDDDNFVETALKSESSSSSMLKTLRNWYELE